MAIPGFFTTASIPMPISPSGIGTSTMRAAVISPIKVFWADGAADTYPQPGKVQVGNLYDGTFTVDGTAFVWLIIFSHGVAVPLWIKEMDLANAGSLVDGVANSGEYGVYMRCDGGQLSRIPQV